MASKGEAGGRFSHPLANLLPRKDIDTCRADHSEGPPRGDRFMIRESPLMPGCFQTLDITRFRRALAQLHTEVSQGRGRVQITRRGSSDVCILISKSELEGLERALEILSETSDFQSMCQTLSQVASAAMGTPVPQA